jgi:ATP-dependent DNA helicase RecQ
MTDTVSDLLPLLHQYFGFPDFREDQKPIVNSILEGRDMLAILKTSGGKSLCYQMPALHRSGTMLVISPLISLMKDQVDALLAKGISAAFVNSNLEAEEAQARYRDLAAGRLKLFYVAPERFQDEGFMAALVSSGIHTVAVDEAHCASQWGHDFRPHYSKIGASLEALEARLGRPIQRIAFTATATDRVREDICKIIGLRNPVVHQRGFDRENLTYAVVPSGKNRHQDIEACLQEHRNENTIIYCTTVKAVEKLYEYLKTTGLPVARYHGRLSPEEKNQVQDDFIQSKTRILISTSAFGMGVDKADIRLVIHAQMPGSLEAWYQEAGRGGRDGLPAKAILFYDPQDRNIHRFFIEMGAPSAEVMKALRPLIYQELMGGPQDLDFNWISKISRAKLQPGQVSSALNLMVGQGEISRHGDNSFALADWNMQANYDWVDDLRRNNWMKVNAMQQWCETTLCRRWTVLKYFGAKEAHTRCGTCDTCLAEALSKSKVGSTLPYVRPITLMNLAKAVNSTGKKWLPILLGTADPSGLLAHEEPWYARFAHYAVGDLERWVVRLTEQKLIDKGLKLTERGEDWIEGNLDDSKLNDQLCQAPKGEKAKASHGIPIEMLHKWRKTTAYADDVSEMSIATEAILRKVHAASSFRSEDLIEAGVSQTWVSKHAKKLQDYVDKQLKKSAAEMGI